MLQSEFLQRVNHLHLARDRRPGEMMNGEVRGGRRGAGGWWLYPGGRAVGGERGEWGP